MAFFVLLTKEMRLRMRQERTVWVMILYVVLLSLLGWLYLSRSTSGSSNIGNDWNTAGTQLYQLLTVVEILLIIFITPSFTSGSINAEKELKTYDMLLCSQISSFSLVAGKLISGLSNVFLLIAASIPLFSLVFFFGGFTPMYILKDLTVFAVTAVMIASFGLLCSILFAKRSTSMAIAYVAVLLWLIVPLIYLSLVPAPVVRGQVDQQYSLHVLAWNPVTILTLNGGMSPYASITYIVAGMSISSWLAYMLLSAGMTLLFFLLSLCFVKPHLLRRVYARFIAYTEKRRKG
jgi:ABC-type transport system involved in multi-copper enzyme maturation permease subunit